MTRCLLCQTPAPAGICPLCALLLTGRPACTVCGALGGPLCASCSEVGQRAGGGLGVDPGAREAPTDLEPLIDWSNHGEAL